MSLQHSSGFEYSRCCSIISPPSNTACCGVPWFRPMRDIRSTKMHPEAFAREFLLGHLGTRAAIGTGEIIDATSRAGGPRNQIDLVVYKSEFPTIDLGGGLNAFCAESVIATIEVKSTLTKSGLEKTIKSSIAMKNLKRHFSSHELLTAPSQDIVGFVVAYNGPSKAKTVLDWLTDLDNRLGVNVGRLPPTGNQRSLLQSGGLEGVFVLGRSSVVFDYDAVSVVTDANRLCYPNAKYQYRNSRSGHLLWLFLLLTHAVSNAWGHWPDFSQYLSATNFENVHFGRNGDQGA
jgi:hypothetical protein